MPVELFSSEEVKTIEDLTNKAYGLRREYDNAGWYDCKSINDVISERCDELTNIIHKYYNQYNTYNNVYETVLLCLANAHRATDNEHNNLREFINHYYTSVISMSEKLANIMADINKNNNTDRSDIVEARSYINTISPSSTVLDMQRIYMNGMIRTSKRLLEIADSHYFFEDDAEYIASLLNILITISKKHLEEITNIARDKNIIKVKGKLNNL